MIEVEV